MPCHIQGTSPARTPTSIGSYGTGKNATQQIKLEGDNREDPGDEGYDPDGKDGAILMDLCEEDQNK